jgi:hypothetical protein
MAVKFSERRLSALEEYKKPILIPLGITNNCLIPCAGGYFQVDTGYEKS